MGKKHKMGGLVPLSLISLILYKMREFSPLKMKKVTYQENLKPYYDLYKGE